MVSSFLFPARLILRLRVRRRRRTQRGKCPPPDSDPFNDAEFSEDYANSSSQFVATPDGRCECSAALLIIQNCLGCGFAQFKLCAHFLDLRGLFFKMGSDGLYFFLLLRNGGLEVAR